MAAPEKALECLLKNHSSAFCKTTLVLVLRALSMLFLSTLVLFQRALECLFLATDYAATEKNC